MQNSAEVKTPTQTVEELTDGTANVKLNVNNDDTKTTAVIDSSEPHAAYEAVNGDVAAETNEEAELPDSAPKAEPAAEENEAAEKDDEKSTVEEVTISIENKESEAQEAVNEAGDLKDEAELQLQIPTVELNGTRDHQEETKEMNEKEYDEKRYEAAVMDQKERSVDPPPPDPDRVAPSDKLCTHLCDEAVKIRLGESNVESRKPLSVPTLLVDTVRRHSHGTALVCTRNGKTKKWTYAQYFDDIKRAARGFLKLGLEVYHGVGILGFNSPEWYIADLAAIVAGGLAVGIYSTNIPEACRYVLEDCKANICVVENDMQLQKILQVRDRLPHLRAIIQYSGKLSGNHAHVYTWSDFMEFGKEVPEEALIQRIRGVAPNRCCTLIYTSGTTGQPKGVMLSHDNMTFISAMCAQQANLRYGQEVFLTYLPLSHIAAQTADIYIPITCGGTVYFAKPDALKGTLKESMVEARPTHFFGVPRVYEKFAAKLKEKGAQSTGLKKAIGSWCKGVGLKNYRNMEKGQAAPHGFGVAHALLFSKVQKELGLDRCVGLYSGAAPISLDLLEYFASVGMNITETFGLSETTGPLTLSFYPHQFKIGSVGVALPGCHTKIDKPDKEGNGELMVKGRLVFMGYLGKPNKTAETIEDNTGWMRTGDIARVDDKGFIYITGRIKEILVTAGGENVAPIQVEDVVKRELPVVSNAMLIGDRKKFISCLLTLKTEVNVDTGAPLDNLTSEAVAWCRSVECQANKVSDILDNNDPNVMRAIQAGIDRVNEQAISRAQKIQKWSVLPRDFSISGGELGSTMKTRRHEVSKMYEKTISNFYRD